MDSISLGELRNYIINLCKINCDNYHCDSDIKQLSVDGEIIELCFIKNWGIKYLYTNTKNKEINDILNSIYEANRFDCYLTSKSKKYAGYGYYILKLVENEYVVYEYNNYSAYYSEIHEDHIIENGNSFPHDYSDLYKIVHEYVRTIHSNNIKLAINGNGNDNDNDNGNGNDNDNDNSKNIYDGEELN